MEVVFPNAGGVLKCSEVPRTIVLIGAFVQSMMCRFLSLSPAPRCVCVKQKSNRIPG